MCFFADDLTSPAALYSIVLIVVDNTADKLEQLADLLAAALDGSNKKRNEKMADGAAALAKLAQHVTLNVIL